MYQHHETTTAWQAIQIRNPDVLCHSQYTRANLCLASDPELEGVSYMHGPVEWKHVEGLTYAAKVPQADILESINQGPTMIDSRYRPTLTVRSVHGGGGMTTLSIPTNGVLQLPLLALQEFEVELRVQAEQSGTSHSLPGVSLRLSVVQSERKVELANKSIFDHAGQRYSIKISDGMWGDPGLWSKLECASIPATSPLSPTDPLNIMPQCVVR